MPYWEYFTERNLGKMARVLQHKRLNAVRHRYGVLSIINNTVLGTVPEVLREYLWPCLCEHLPNPLEVLVQRDWVVRNLQLVETALQIRYHEQALQYLKKISVLPTTNIIRCEHTVEDVTFIWNPRANF